MSDSRATLERELRERREPYVHATVVRAQRPTSAHAGDTAVVRASGEIDGFVGGTCVEASVRLYSMQVLMSLQPLLLKVVAGMPSKTVEDGAVEVSNPCVSGGAIEIFLEPRIPLPRMVIVGYTPDAEALAALAPLVGFDVVQADGASTTAQAGDAALIVASHGRDEETALLTALQAGVQYVALVASPKRGRAVLDSLDVSVEQRARVFSPAGLDLGARTPGEVAVSILAQLVQERAAATHPHPAAEADHNATVAIDPVCGMSVALPSAMHVEHNGTAVYFCCAACRAAFLADPDKYAVAV